MSMHPWEDVMLHEKKGGWGRHLKGTVAAIAALHEQTKLPNSRDLVNELQEYYDDSLLARKLQAPGVYVFADVSACVSVSV